MYRAPSRQWTFLSLAALIALGSIAHPAPVFSKAAITRPTHARSPAGADLVTETYAHLRDLENTQPPGVKVRKIASVDGHPLLAVEVKARHPNAPRVFLASGVHGDEPGGVSTGMRFLEAAIKTRRFHLTYVPMVNPEGLRRGWRRNLAEQDINRTFGEPPGSAAARAIQAAISGQRFDVAVDLHGANKKTQFFVIAAHEQGARAEEILRRVPPELLLPSDSGTYPGYARGLKDPKRYRMLNPGFAISTNEGTLKDLLARQSARSYTLEYPGAIPADLQQEWNYRILISILDPDADAGSDNSQPSEPK